ncbi:MAG: DNA polymerase III subunit delta [Alistipes sp.]|jgi:DNA polymerase-3 subunit delta|nr:DNA polymerase III subunit delta [Alistipes sp.]
MAKSAVKFKESAAAFEAIGKDISAGRFAPLYLLMGEEEWFIDRLADRLASETLDEAARAFNLTVVYGRDTATGAIINTARQMPMMGSRQVIIVREAQQLRKIEELQLYTAAPAPSTILVLCHKEKNLDKRTQLYKHIAAKGVVLESVRPRDYEIREWLAGFVASRGLKADPKALEMLVEHLGMEISKISNELDKLLLAMPEGTTRLTPDIVENTTGFSREFNNFELLKAVCARAEVRAMSIADNFARNPREHPLIVTIMSLFGQFRQIFTYNYLVWQSRRQGTAMPSDVELMGLLRLPGPWFVGEVRTAAAAWPNKITFKVLGLLREYDARSKGIGTGGLSDGELLRELLLKIFLTR